MEREFNAKIAKSAKAARDHSVLILVISPFSDLRKSTNFTS